MIFGVFRQDDCSLSNDCSGVTDTMFVIILKLFITSRLVSPLTASCRT